MQGKKHYQPKLFNNFNLADRVPKNSFYRRLKGSIDFQFLYKLTDSCYGKCGQKSIDPVVFFKICLVGYLENIISDRQLIDHCNVQGTDLRNIQALLGHNSLKTTEIYTHVAANAFNKIKNLLD